MNAVKGQYKGAFRFFRKSLWKPALICALLFFAVLAATAALLAERPEQTQELMKLIRDIFSMKALEVGGKLSAMGILANNLKTSGLMVLLGLIPFLFLPILGLVENACIVGVILVGTGLNGVSPQAFAAGLVPHGVFELPALFLAAALGCILCMEVIRKLLGNRKTKFLQTFAEICRFFLLIVLPLLIVAAVMEAYVSPAVMNYFI